MKSLLKLTSPDVAFFILAGATLLGLLSGFIIYFVISFRQKQRAYTLLEWQKQEIENQREKAEKALLDLKTAQVTLIQKEKMASLGELTAGIAHEIQNPLNFVNNFSEINSELIEELKQSLQLNDKEMAISVIASLEENNGKILQHGKRADTIVKGMLEHSRNSKSEKQPVNINTLVDECLHLANLSMRTKDKEFTVNLQTNYDQKIGQINVVTQDIGRVLINIFNNAFYALNEKKKEGNSAFVPTVFVSTQRTANKVEICIQDNGNGIPEKVASKIFQPFFTTKPAGQGTGLGLSLSYDIITKEHSGELKMQTKEKEFTEFTISLPVS